MCRALRSPREDWLCLEIAEGPTCAVNVVGLIASGDLPFVPICAPCKLGFLRRRKNIRNQSTPFAAAWRSPGVASSWHLPHYPQRTSNLQPARATAGQTWLSGPSNRLT